MVIHHIWLHMPIILALDKKGQADLLSTSHQDCIMKVCLKKSKKQNNINKNPGNQPSKHQTKHTSQASWFHIRDSRLVQYIQI